MKLDYDFAATTSLLLDKCTVGLRQTGPWCWHSMAQNGTLLPIESRLEEGFLQLATRPEPQQRGAAELERALLANGVLPGGVGVVLDPVSARLRMRADIPLMDDTRLEEEYLLHRLHRSLDGFHEGAGLLKSLDSGSSFPAQPAAASCAGLAELLRESAWNCEERGPNDFAATLDAGSAPPAKVRMTEHGLQLSVDLVRPDAAAGAVRPALAVFLLAASGVLRMARAYAVETDGAWSFGFRVCLPAAPAPDEIDHALAALSVAHRMSARETSVLLDEAAARCYLAARNLSTTNQPNRETEKNHG
jgi:hypothetical protein